MADSSLYETGYPPQLRKEEERLLQARRRAAGHAPAEVHPGDAVGVALSGGGIRSATFCLGLFQSLSKNGLLGRVDYLSTVSGGGYFGSFLGRLFTRDFIKNPTDVEQVLQGKKDPEVLRALRENGRYLSPNGAGDLLLGGAALLRNWVAIHVVLGLLFVTLFLLADVLVWLAFVASNRVMGPSLPSAVLSAMAGANSTVHISAWTIPLVVLLLLAVVPLGWAYWLIETRVVPWLCSFGGLVLFIALSVFLIATHHTFFGVACAVVGISTLSWVPISYFRASRTVEYTRDYCQRNLLSKWLRTALVLAFGLLVFSLIDTAGHTIYQMLAREGGSTFLKSGLGVVGALPLLAAFGRKVAILFDGRVDGKRPSLPVAAIATLAALLLVAILLIGLNVLSHFISWNTSHAPDISWTTATDVREGLHQLRLPAPFAAFGFCLLFSLICGQTSSFLNRSSHQPLYSARLTRAYLGSSNPGRVMASSHHKPYVRLSDVADGDDLHLEKYWSRDIRPRAQGIPEEERTGEKPGSFGSEPETDSPPYPNGAPLHLINVTINETVDGRSQIQQQDRKGTGLALGPCGMSVGVSHHAIFDWSQRKARRGAASEKGADGPEAPIYLPAKGNVFEGFDGKKNQELLPFDILTLGAWVSISGAAFSTGLGARTNLGLSLLCGMGNVRLGQWWGSGIRDRAKKGVLSLPRLAFPVQSYLLSEFVSRFPGTAQKRWYLSDGGHFENMGAYELIRRRIRFICVIDAEADSDYTFEGLANLVRKARLDFKAEIHFLTQEELSRTVHPRHYPYFGTLERLRRGKWTTAGATSDELLVEPDATCFSRAHAALARVTYEETRETSLLLYVKPSLTGDEPSDVIRYHSEHASFPHESTIDQFFDEAQWESYRKLGEHVGEALLAPLPGPGERDSREDSIAWTPRDLFERKSPVVPQTGMS